MKYLYHSTAVLLLLLTAPQLSAQQPVKWYSLKNFSGGLESTAHYYFNDKKTGVEAPYQRFASNTYINLNYGYKFIDAGIQVESYNPRLQGYAVQYDSITKLVHRFVRIKTKYAELTAGHFYDQFGAGYLFRAYEQREIGIDNIIDGLHLKLMPSDRLRIKGFYGRQRNFMTYSPAKIWGADAEGEVYRRKTEKNNTVVTIGAGIISKKQETDVPLPDFPDVITAAGGRINFLHNNYSLYTEYVYKTIEPDFNNKFIYKTGSTLLINQAYTSPKGWGINLSLRRLENMDFKSDYNSTEAVNSLNYLPALTRQHSYLVANIYPHNTQVLSEIGGQADFNHLFKKGTALGGKYGMKLSVNVSLYNALDTTRVATREGFTSKFLAMGKTKLFRDVNVAVEKRWTSRFKSTFTYMHLFYNKSVLQGGPFGNVDANILVADLLFKLNSRSSLRTEVQHLFTNDDEKNWAALLAEFTMTNGLSLYASDLTDYQRSETHYFNVGAAYSRNALRVSLGCSRQRAGLFCVGGLCRFLPSFTGLSAGLNYNF